MMTVLPSPPLLLLLILLLLLLLLPGQICSITLGIAAARSRRLNAILDPILDTMQTMPSFVYLIPAVTFFSIGKPPGVIATVIFALPPIVRLTTLGLVRWIGVRRHSSALGASARVGERTNGVNGRRH